MERSGIDRTQGQAALERNQGETCWLTANMQKAVRLPKPRGI
jgi:hypothetical protein